MSSFRLARLTAICGLAAATVLVPMSQAPATAFSSSGTITQPAPAGNGTTDLEFGLTCPAAPSTQGVNGWVFALPAAAAAGDTVSVTGSDPTGLYDLAAYVYKSGCTYDRVETAGKDLHLTLQAGDQYLSVFASNGANVAVTFSSPGVVSGGGSNDPLFEQDGEGDLFYAGQWGLRKINAPQAWSVATGAGITVADLDTGLDLTHPDFACPGKIKLLPGNASDPDPDGSNDPEDDNGHGTHTAGIIGACTGNGIGVAGVAPDSILMPIQVLSDTSSDAATLETAIDTAVANGAHVINMSLGFSAAGAPATGSVLGFFGGFPGVRRAIEDAVAAGVVVVAASGNENSPLCGYPAIEWNVLCVGATDSRDLPTRYGNLPIHDDDQDLVGPALVAPGGAGGVFCDMSSEEIISTYDRSADAAEGNCDLLDGYASIAGTSMATPHVVGVAALVYDKLGGVRSKANADKVVEALLNSAKDLYTPGFDPIAGYGRVDALAAVNYWP